ncbi:MAG: hypothetical protein ACXABY_06880 [Candidatus Thorarchaeota archaeon]
MGTKFIVVDRVTGERIDCNSRKRAVEWVWGLNQGVATWDELNARTFRRKDTNP